MDAGLVGRGSVEANNFVLGHVTVFPGGSIPLNEHEQEEVYTILQGRGLMRVGEEESEVEAVASIYIPPGAPHQLLNTGSDDLVLFFAYSPGGDVGHWQEERAGRWQTLPSY